MALVEESEQIEEEVDVSQPEGQGEAATGGRSG